MKKRVLIPKFLFAVFILITLCLSACKGNDKDTSIQIAIASKTASNANLAGVSAMVIDGVVTLTGQCKDEACRTNAEQDIRKIDGVKNVVNNIMVNPSVVITPDKELRAATKKVVDNYGGVQADVTNGIITLRGVIKQKKLPQLMMDLNALQPKRIDNQLAVK